MKLVATTGATWYLTGVQLEKGSTATSFDYRPYGTELALCQRYAYVANGQGAIPFVSGIANSTTSAYLTYVLPVIPRTTPTLTVSGRVAISDQYANDYAATPPTVVTAPNGAYTTGRCQLGSFSGLTIGRFYGGAPDATGTATFNMEL